MISDARALPAAVDDDVRSEPRPGLDPRVLGYASIPIALVTLLVLGRYHLIANQPTWLWLSVFAAICCAWETVDRIHRRVGTRVTLHARVAVQVAAVTAVIYLNGWGPALIEAYAFTALENTAHEPSKTWRITVLWSLVGVAFGQLAVLRGWVPSMLSVSEGWALCLLGVVVLVFVIRMAAATMARKEDAEVLLAHRALHDPLTGLPNRQLIMDRAEQMLARGHRERRPVAVFFIDLDDFKDVNDTLGHGAGDKLLKAVAERFVDTVRASDTVGRLGGDEFVVLAEGASLSEGLEPVAQRIQDALRAPFVLDGYEGTSLAVSASVGIASGDQTSVQDLLAAADVALYRAKAAGKHCCAIFEAGMQSDVVDRLSLKLDLHTALDRHEYFLLYQPVFDLDHVRTCGVEALVRWRHPVRGVVSPDQFIPVLEETGAIVEVGRWVLEEACRQAVRWRRQGLDLSMSVNVSMRQFETDAFIDHVRHALAASTLDAGSLIIEITESTLMRDAEATIERLGQLKQIGVHIAIDDFGTGYSSFAYLQRFPVDALKIDRSFVAALGSSNESSALMHTLVELGHNLGIETLAEGIENQAQLESLRDEQCKLGQGFLYSAPVDAGGIEQLFSTLQASAEAGDG